MFDQIAGLISSIGITDMLDIAIVAYLVYKVLGFIRETRAQQLVRGIILVFVVFLVSQLLNLSLLNWLLKSLITVGLIAIVVLFQPELRRGLEQLGRRGVFTNQFRNVSKDDAIETIHNIVYACEDFSASRTGALIVIERQTMLNDIIETGVVINADISTRLLGNLFYEGSPLHDGAIIIRGTKAYAASCVLPLTARTNIGGNLGTRHRAGVGVSEVSDAFVIIVSEESGAISVAENGKLRRFLDGKALEKLLLEIYMPTDEKRDFLSEILGGKRDVR